MMIRPARPGDLPELLYVEEESFSEQNVDLLRTLCGVSETFLVDDSGDGVRGYVLGTLHPGRRGRVASLAVLPEHRRCGVASRLMEALLERMRERDVEEVELEVRASNGAAIELYRELGFAVGGVKPGYYSDGEDAYLMERRL